jgi:hypothetical protein
VLTIVFVLGFIADPIINFALDPYGTILYGDPGLLYDPPTQRAPRRQQLERSGWTEHFTKGIASLGLVSFLKFMFTSPIQFFFRGGGVVGGRQTGRDRLNTMTWVMILVGVATFLYVSVISNPPSV